MNVRQGIEHALILGLIKPTEALAKTCCLEQLISLNDLAKSFFRPAVTTICIGMVLLHKFFIARLDHIASRICIKTERRKRLYFQSARFALHSFGSAGIAFRIFDEIERIAQTIVIGSRTRTTGRHIRRRACGSGGVGCRRPSRAIASDRILLEFRDFAVGQTGEIIEILIIFPDMIHAEMKVFTLAHAPDRRTMRARLIATVPLAAGTAGLLFRFLLGTDADAVEKF